MESPERLLLGGRGCGAKGINPYLTRELEHSPSSLISGNGCKTKKQVNPPTANNNQRWRKDLQLECEKRGGRQTDSFGDALNLK